MSPRRKIDTYRFSQDIKDAVRFEQMQRVLVVKLRHHGDVLLSSPVFQALKKRYPQLEIDALVYEHTRDMLANHPDVANIFGVDRSWKKLGPLQHMRQETALLETLRQRNYDLLIMLTDQYRGAFLARALKTPVSVVSVLGNRPQRFWRNSFTHKYPTPVPRNKIEFHLDALRRLGMVVDAEEFPTRMFASEAQQRKVNELLASEGLENDRFLLVHPGSRWFYKCWEDRKYAAVINHYQKLGIKVAITGAPSAEEQDLIDRLVSHCEQTPVMLNGKLSLPELAETIRRARCFFGVDSAPMHMAQAVGTALVALFGPTDLGIWSPTAANSRVLTGPQNCIPCLQHGCGGSGRSDCILGIEAQQVITEITPMLGDLVVQ